MWEQALLLPPRKCREEKSHAAYEGKGGYDSGRGGQRIVGEIRRAHLELLTSCSLSGWSNDQPLAAMMKCSRTDFTVCTHHPWKVLTQTQWTLSKLFSPLILLCTGCSAPSSSGISPHDRHDMLEWTSWASCWLIKFLDTRATTHRRLAEVCETLELLWVWDKLTFGPIWTKWWVDNW